VKRRRISTRPENPLHFPGWEKLRKEEAEDKPEIVLTVSDESGQVIRRITGPGSKGSTGSPGTYVTRRSSRSSSRRRSERNGREPPRGRSSCRGRSRFRWLKRLRAS